MFRAVLCTTTVLQAVLADELIRLAGLGLVSFCVFNQGQFVSHRVSYYVLLCIIWFLFGCQYQRNRLKWPIVCRVDVKLYWLTHSSENQDIWPRWLMQCMAFRYNFKIVFIPRDRSLDLNIRLFDTLTSKAHHYTHHHQNWSSCPVS